MKMRRGGDRKCKTTSSATSREVGLPARGMHNPSAAVERRKKPREDPRHGTSSRGKKSRRRTSPPPKRRKVIEVTSSTSEEAEEYRHGRSMSKREQSLSRGYPTESGAEDSEGSNDDAIQTSQAHPTRGAARGGMKKHVELDAQGQPFGPMKEVLCNDIKKYAKDLDPTTGWEGQPRSDRKRLLQRLYAGEYISLMSLGRLKEHAHVWLDVSGEIWTCQVRHANGHEEV